MIGSSFIPANFHELNAKDKHGLIVIVIVIISRTFVVSIAWSYGTFLKALKEKYVESNFFELGWIAGLAQGLGALISPAYVILAKRIGYRLTFTLGMALCTISLLMSSFVPNEHFLFFTYSIPFGIGSGMALVLGSVVTGLYYPPRSGYHIMATVAISLGFPLGFLVLNFINETLMSFFNDWQKIQLIYSFIALACTIAAYKFFTAEFAENEEQESESAQNDIVYKDEHPLPFGWTNKDKLAYFIRFLWLGGLLLNSCAHNSVMIHLNGYFKKIGLDQSELKDSMFAIGISDGATRILLAMKGHILRNNLVFCYVASCLIGFVVSVIWSFQTTPGFNTLYCIFYGVCPAVLMSLMYSVNTEITGSSSVQKNYTINVMTSGIGIILGPIISGAVLDSSIVSYDWVFKLSFTLYLFALAFYSTSKYLLMKYTYVTTAFDAVIGDEHTGGGGGYEELK